MNHLFPLLLRNITCCFLWFSIFLCHSLFCQTPKTPHKKIDSLSYILNNLKKENKTKILIELASQYNNIHNDSAKIYLSLAITDTRKTNNSEQLLRIYDEFGKFYKWKRDYKKSFDFYNKKLAIAKHKLYKDKVLKSFLDIAIIEIQLNNLKKAKKYIDSATSYKDEFKLKDDLSYYYNVIGYYYSINEDLKNSLENYLKAIEHYKSEKDFISKAGIYNNIGLIFSRTKDYHNAIKNYERSLAISKRINNNTYISKNYINIGVSYAKLNNTDQAITYFKKALSTLETNGNKSLIANTHNNLGEAFLTRKEYSKANHHYEIATDLFKQLGDLKRYSNTIQNSVKFYLMTKDFDKGEELLNKALQISKENNFPKNIPELYKIKSSLDSAQGNYKLAFSDYKKFKHISDSLEKAYNTDKVRVLQAKYEASEKEKEIQLLHAENKTKDIEISKQRYEKYMLLVIIFFSILVISIFYFLFSSKVKLNRKLRLKNDEVKEKSDQFESALVEKEILLREIHHRVKNNLQLVSSMLYIQAQYMEDKKIKQFIDRSHNRIASMALVHETLYNNKNLNRINFQEYLIKLINAIYSSFDFSSQEICYDIEANNIFFNIETAIPLGIIINELVYNAFKHAFKGQKTGKIIIEVSKQSSTLGTLRIQDNGIGIPKPIKEKKKSSYGLQLANLLVKQLSGTMDIDSSKEGTIIVACFSFKSTITKPKVSLNYDD